MADINYLVELRLQVWCVFTSGQPATSYENQKAAIDSAIGMAKMKIMARSGVTTAVSIVKNHKSPTIIYRSDPHKGQPI